MARLTTYDERLRIAGVSASEISRMRQYERFMGEAMESLRMVKMYRTPQALRSFARIFTLILPAFYAPTFAQLARDVESLGMGISFGLLVAVGLSGLFNAIQCLEDPFVGFLTLDGINVTEEFEVLQWQQLVNARAVLFPEAPLFPYGTRMALPSGTPIPELTKARTEGKHQKVVSWDQGNLAAIGFGQFVGDLRNEEDDPMMRERINTEDSVPLADIRISQFAEFLPEDELDDNVIEEEEDDDKTPPTGNHDTEQDDDEESALDIPSAPPSPSVRHRRTLSSNRAFSRAGSSRARRGSGAWRVDHGFDHGSFRGREHRGSNHSYEY